MEKLKDIDFAIIETILAHPDFTPTINAMVFDTITSKFIKSESKVIQNKLIKTQK